MFIWHPLEGAGRFPWESYPGVVDWTNHPTSILSVLHKVPHLPTSLVTIVGLKDHLIPPERISNAPGRGQAHVWPFSGKGGEMDGMQIVLTNNKLKSDFLKQK